MTNIMKKETNLLKSTKYAAHPGFKFCILRNILLNSVTSNA